MTKAISDLRTALLRILATHSFRLGEFTLASGQRSDYYIDCRTTTLHAEGGRLSGLVFYDLIREHIPRAVAVGGLTMGADPLVSNTASASAWAVADNAQVLELSSELDLRGASVPSKAPHFLHGFLVRKAEKTHGAGRRIEGFLEPGANVVIVDDVCTTGGSTMIAIEAAREAGMLVTGVLCLVDRGQGGRSADRSRDRAGTLFLGLHRGRYPSAHVKVDHESAGADPEQADLPRPRYGAPECRLYLAKEAPNKRLLQH